MTFKRSNYKYTEKKKIMKPTIFPNAVVFAKHIHMKDSFIIKSTRLVVK